MKLAASSCLVAFCLCAQAIAETRLPVELILPSCDTPPIDSHDLQQALQVEFRAAGFELAADPGTRVVIEYPDCRIDAADLKVTIDFKVPSKTNASLHTRVLLSDVPQASRARTVAVAVAELVRVTRPPPWPVTASPAPTQAVPLPSPKLVGPPVTTAPLAAASRHGRVSVGAGAQVAWLGAETGAFLGGTVLVGVDVASRWRSRVSLAWLQNSVTSSFGPIDFTVYGGTIGWDLLVSTWPILAIGPELSMAGVRAQGHSSLGVTESTQALWFSSGGARLALEVPLYKALRLTANANVATALHSALFTAGNKNAAEFAGLQGGWAVGFSFQP